MAVTIYCLHSLVAQTCTGMHAHTDALTHHVFYWIVSHFLLSETYPPFLPLPSYSPPILSSCLPCSPFLRHSSASLTWSVCSYLIFFIPLSCRFFIPYFPFFLTLSLNTVRLCFLSSFCGPPLAPLTGCRPVWVRDRL